VGADGDLGGEEELPTAVIISARTALERRSNRGDKARGFSVVARPVVL